jgi:transcriptional regulator with XRE-family HTH domain
LNTTSKLAEKLQDKDYRSAFVASQIEIGIPFQIRSLMTQRGWTQDQLAEKTGMRQPSISGLMRPGKTKPNIETLRRIAEAFDCGLAVRFVSFGDLVDWSDSFEPDSFSVKGFEEEMADLLEKEHRTSPLMSPLAGLHDRLSPETLAFFESMNSAHRGQSSGLQGNCRGAESSPQDYGRLDRMAGPMTTSKPPGVESGKSPDRLGEGRGLFLVPDMATTKITGRKMERKSSGHHRMPSKRKAS